MASLYCLTSCYEYHNPTRIIEFRSKKLHMRSYTVRCEGTNIPTINLNLDEEKGPARRLRILIAGGGIGGLVLALAAKRRGYDVKVFEKNLSATRGEGRDRGPIQLLSSALAMLQAIDENVAKQVMEAGCVTGNRINGFADGVSGKWFTKFDLLTPAVRRGLPVTQVICRMELQDILVDAVGLEILSTKSEVVDFMQDSSKVTVILEDGLQHDGDILIGADGIWSTVRTKLFGHQEAKYSGYTCYSGLTNFVPPYIDTVASRVYLGLNMYFVAVEIGNGKMQWYAFHKEPCMKTDPPRGKKKRLLELFGHWCHEVITLISETQEDMVLRRDIYDRDMICTWGIGCVTLLGDAAHPILPNLGLGGCMAIEDSYQLILELDKVAKCDSAIQLSDDIASALRSYEKKRTFRVSTMHAASRMASKLLAFYQPYLKFGPGHVSDLSTLLIIKPVFGVAQIVMQFCVSQFMIWTIAGHG